MMQTELDHRRRWVWARAVTALALAALAWALMASGWR
jgi:hypothetical protein